MTADALIRLRYRLLPDRLVGEILSKSWIDSAIPALVLVLVVLCMNAAIPGFLSAGNLADLSRQLSEVGPDCDRHDNGHAVGGH